ncbi:MAG: transcriptional repressor [Firmicutes bacterium]|nr:transcriptional repressor [Bacillota bacterium]
MEEKINYINSLLKRKGYKMTYTRGLIVKVFIKNPDKHFTKKDIYLKLKKEGNNIGIATVYRNIELFKENNIIDEFIRKNEILYELKLFSKKIIHAHFICNNCKKIIDYKNTDCSLKIIKAIDVLEKKHDFEITNVDVAFLGKCENCIN